MPNFATFRSHIVRATLLKGRLTPEKPADSPVEVPWKTLARHDSVTLQRIWTAAGTVNVE